MMLGMTELHGRLDQALALLRKLDACSNWLSVCVQASLIERVSPDEQYLLICNPPARPLPPHEIVMHVVTSRAVANGTSMALVRAEAALAHIARNPGIARLALADTSWLLTQQANDRLRVDLRLHVDPIANLPAWAVNCGALQIPFDSLRNFRRALETPDRWQ